MIQKPKGTNDLFKTEANKVLAVTSLLESMAEKYNYQFIRTPIFERSELFHRGVGETTDIVTKETYDFVDRGDRTMTLRPEGTAGVVRSFIENKMYADGLTKVWYYGPMFRYERPQSGRFREFYQFGIEAFGSSDPLIDAEVISFGVNIYKMLGLKGVKVKINSLGDNESRIAYKEALKAYFKPHLSELCPDCNKRFDTNPLRILDCKFDAELDIMKHAPSMNEYLNEISKNYFDEVQKYLKDLAIEFEVKDTLVRGLDYYNHTVFEIEADIKGFGSQNVLCAGGRYNSMVEDLDGPATPGIGFALGMERLLAALDAEEIVMNDDNALDVFILYAEEAAKGYVAALVQDLRLNGFKVDMEYQGKNLKGQFKTADKYQAKYLIIIGSNEINSNEFEVKDNLTKETTKVLKDALIDFLDINIGE